jgi:hypothetical protein
MNKILTLTTTLAMLASVSTSFGFNSVSELNFNDQSSAMAEDVYRQQVEAAKHRGDITMAHALHNGSVLQVFTQKPSPDGLSQFFMYYDQPSPQMSHLVRPGTLLVDGTANLKDASIVGNARVFLSGCPWSFPYRVLGQFTERGTTLTS